jgi:hypothetical protein
MADQKLTELGALSALTTDDLFYVVDDPSGAATSKKLATSVLDARYLLEANNLSDLDNASTARTNLGVAIGTDVFTQRTITGTANQVTVTNGNGVSGNPTLATPQDIHTAATPEFDGLTIGSANGADFNPGSDTDTDLITVGVTGAPKMLWDESDDDFSFNKGIDLTNWAFYQLTPGADANANIIRLNVTGGPRLWWDEAGDRFRSEHGKRIDQIRSSGGLLEFALVQDTPNASDTDDSTLFGYYKLLANSATNELVVRAFNLLVNNQLTGGGVLQNARVFNLSLETQAGTTITNAPMIFMEAGTANGTVTTGYGLYMVNMQGTTKWSILDDTQGTWVKSNGKFLIGDSVNGNQVVGITINQKANDDEILAFKSSDIAHANTGETETDTFATFKKASATLGGLAIKAYTDGIASGSVSGMLFDTGNLVITGGSTSYFQNHFAKSDVTAASGLTIVNAATVYIDNAPDDIGSATITNKYALWSDAGLNRFDGNGTDVFEVPADATANTGNEAGRIPIRVGGTTKYLRYYDD